MNFSLPTGGKVMGVGVDIIECDRIEKAWKRQSERFLEMVFTERERQYCLAMKNPAPYLAVRFAAKEAVAKCFSTGIGEHLGWQSIEVIKGEREQPLIRLDEKAQSLLKQLGGSDVLISLSHTQQQAIAFAVLVGAA